MGGPFREDEDLDEEDLDDEDVVDDPPEYAERLTDGFALLGEDE